jgi:hydrophobe/amphiphile efflux-1 (HAE1) family protein
MALFNISAPFIRRPVGTSLLAIGLFLVGVIARIYLPVAPLPNVELPIIFSWVTQPGASPETMAATIAAPLERRFAQISGLNEITSSNSLGTSLIIMQFDFDRSAAGAARDVAAAINAASADLPAGMPSAPIYRKANPNNAPVLVLALTSETYTLGQLYNFADSLLAQRISQIKGVSQVDVVGGAQPAVHIEVDPVALAAMGLSLDSVRNALSGLTANAPKGAVMDDDRTYIIAANDQLSTVEDFRKLVVGVRNGTPVRLSAIANVTEGQLNPYQRGWLNKQPAVLLIVRKQASANVIETVDGVKALLPQLQKWLPPAVNLSIQTDRTLTIRASVRDVQISLMLSIALVVMVMLLFLRRGVPTAIAGITIPMAITVTFAAMWLLGFSIDNFSLMALTIAVGFVVDDAIVVIENVVRHLERGEKPLQAALQAGREIGFTVLSMSLSLIAVFIPILFMSGVVGMLFREFSVTLAVAIAVSGIVSLTLTPTLCARFMRAEKDEKPPGRLMHLFERGFNVLLAWYQRGLDWALAHSRVMLAITVAAVGLTFYLYAAVPKGFFPQQDTAMLMGMAEGSQDISFDAIVSKLQQGMDIVLADPEVKSMGTFIGGGHNASNSASMYISLRQRDEGRKDSVDQIIARLRPKLEKIVGLSVYLQPVSDLHVGGRGSKGQYMYSLQAADLHELYAWVPKLAARLKTLPQLKDVSSDLEKQGLQTNVVVDRDAASRLGLTMAEIDRALGNAFGQTEILVTYTQLNEYRVILEVPPSQQRGPSDLDRIYLRSASGRSVPLSTVAHYEMGIAPLQVNHDGQFPVVNISYNLAPGVSLGNATQLIEQTMSELHMPGSIHGNFAGNAQLFVNSMKSLPTLIITALLAVYIVLGMLYESLIHPLTILSTLPTAGIGALLAMLVTGTDLSIVSIIGIILLIGIVKKNAIMMIDFAIHAERNEGLSPRDAIYQACLIRFRPIMMTTFAALFGALPLAIGMGTGSELRQPLGIAVIGGLLLSQVLTLFTTPVVYLTLDRWAQRHKKPAPAFTLPATSGQGGP